jgi:hypothetical protein
MKSLIIIFFLGFTTSAFAAVGSGGATDVGIMFGMKDADFSGDGSNNYDYDSKSAVMLGVIAIGDMSGILFRTGGYYTERKTTLSTSATNADLKITTIDIPVTLLYKFNDMLGVFAGPLFAVKVSDKCSGDATICASKEGSDVKSLHTALTAGLNAKFHPNWSAEVFYEYGLTDISKNTTVNSISLDAIFTY